MHDFELKLNSFVSGVTDLLTKHQQKLNFFREIKVVSGRRYEKIVVGGSAFCFIDKTNGDVLKPASYSAPAKIARGNIFDSHNGLKHITVYGPASLR